jgi:very-long-chain enoyl-CoA reductase
LYNYNYNYNTMVSVTVSLKGKPTINCDFPSKSPNNVTVRDIKAAVQAKFPKVGPG